MSEHNGGFERRVYRIAFAQDTGFGGLEITCRAPSMRVLLAMEAKIPDAVMAAGLAVAAGGSPGISEIPGGTSQAVEETFRLLASQIISWNITEDGEPVSPGYDALMDQDFPTIMAILGAYEKEVMTISLVPPPLRRTSGTPPASPAAPRMQIPMTPLEPESPAS